MVDRRVVSSYPVSGMAGSGCKLMTEHSATSDKGHSDSLVTEDKPPNKGQAESYTLYRSPLKKRTIFLKWLVPKVGSTVIKDGASTTVLTWCHLPRPASGHQLVAFHQQHSSAPVQTVACLSAPSSRDSPARHC